MSRRHVVYTYGYIPKTRSYGLSNLIGDLVLTVITGGLWLVWIIIREVIL